MLRGQVPGPARKPMRRLLISSYEGSSLEGFNKSAGCCAATSVAKNCDRSVMPSHSICPAILAQFHPLDSRTKELLTSSEGAGCLSSFLDLEACLTMGGQTRSRWHNKRLR